MRGNILWLYLLAVIKASKEADCTQEFLGVHCDTFQSSNNAVESLQFDLTFSFFVEITLIDIISQTKHWSAAALLISELGID